jgi:mono/diheme cytochrome c family protein
VRRRAALALLLLVAACAAGPDEDGFDFARMRCQPKYLPYDESRFFPDGRAMRVPPAGTVAYGGPAGPPALTTGLAGGLPVARVPLAVTPALLERGRERFDIYCAACHGVLGDGRSAVARSMQLRPPPSLHLARIRALPDGRIFQVATEGYGVMPSYAAELSVTERWAVVAYVRALQLSQSVPAGALPAAVRAELSRAPGTPPPPPGADR